MRSSRRSTAATKRQLRVGDYLRYTRFRGDELTEPMWAVVTQLPAGTQGRAAILIKGSAANFGDPGKALVFDLEIRDSERAQRTDFAPDDVPDEVVVEEARRAMLGVRS